MANSKKEEASMWGDTTPEEEEKEIKMAIASPVPHIWRLKDKPTPDNIHPLDVKNKCKHCDKYDEECECYCSDCGELMDDCMCHFHDDHEWCEDCDSCIDCEDCDCEREEEEAIPAQIIRPAEPQIGFRIVERNEGDGRVIDAIGYNPATANGNEVDADIERAIDTMLEEVGAIPEAW